MSSFKVRTHSFGFIVLLILALSPSGLWSQTSQIAPEPRRYWFGKCPESTYMGIEVQVHGRMIHRSSFPICPVDARSTEKEDRPKIVAFFMKGGNVFQGKYRTTPTQTIEGNIWQAGADPGAITFGLSFSAKGQVLLNTVHVAEVNRESESEIDSGITVRTFPIRHEKSK